MKLRLLAALGVAASLGACGGGGGGGGQDASAAFFAAVAAIAAAPSSTTEPISVDGFTGAQSTTAEPAPI